MSASVTLKTTARAETGSRAAARLRKQGLVPAIVYGHKQANVSLAVNAKELDQAIRVQHARVLDLDIEGKTETVLIRELQWDYLGKEMIHVDFERKDRAELVRVSVPVALKNAPKATGGGVLDQPFHALHVECPLGAIPESIAIDITNLTLGHPIHIRDLALPPGVKVLDAPEGVVVQLKLPGVEAEPTATDAGVGPEVIKPEKKKADDDDAAPAKK
ncbi:50S ribosomal protein L25 [Gemmata obscuriglobus]|uniref:Large ribosomal subunit protein bL25 n=1 Tax=Gemmata obscuriglobus TaxID=114 RepID=A0A2Z3H752_9BACT|nr:50S ribosomal protein L25 [Gemmata obscuriglobus]AWM38795.1 50S ribosomal protein L25 [Gemmata obscuriglobus]QEG28226.1 50S ribosomal protein L25 [Gemmata obscuriglobus]VTS05989.1 50s ribosomal protein l25 : 50S ribosomal protein L25 OS=Singulisphaera acidiphila (strain ATCC BAA-1392 / DSM 18658 / VKM B-2454 / MOB10) GN=rplY PE=3 SV=1: Ribosomal_L25p: Ribosomal_TL5_C [Gemmata obscuriglobus UQM 2246]